MKKLQLKKVMDEKGISQGKLSRQADVPIETIRKMIRDPYYNATINTLMRIVEVLGVGIDDLYIEEDAPNPEV